MPTFSARWDNGAWWWKAKQPGKPNKTRNPKAKEVRVSEDRDEEESDEKESESDDEDPKGPGWQICDPATLVKACASRKQRVSPTQNSEKR